MEFIAAAFFLVCLNLPFANGQFWQVERAIRDTILNSSTYDPDIRPYSPVEITSTFVIFALNNLDIAGQEMSASGVLYTGWSDYRLMWDPSLYDGIISIMVPHGSVWLPPLIVENSATEMTYLGSKEKVHQRIYADGTVKWMIPLVSKVTCEMKILKFPFDSQSCGLKIYTWAHQLTEMSIIHPYPILTEYYSPNGEWDLIGSSISRDNVSDGIEVFSKLGIKMHFKRKWVFLGLSLITPAILNSLLMCAVFALSFESGEKLSYALTVLLTYIVLLTLVADSLPPISTDISVLQIYLTGVMCVGTIATLLTVLTVSVYNQNTQKPRPKWLLSLCHYMLAPLACRTRCGSHNAENSGTSSRNRIQSIDISTLNDSQAGLDGIPPVSKRFQNGMRTPTNDTLILKDTTFDHDFFRSRPPTSENLRLEDTFSGEGTQRPPRYNNSKRDKTRTDCVRNDYEVDYSWKEVAELMDSAFLRIISFVIGTGTVALLAYYIAIY